MKKNSASLEGSVVVSVRGGKLRIPMSLPFGNVRPLRMLPVFHKIADTFVEHFERLAEEEGGKVSCKKGCGACCKQLVPVSEIETHWIKEVVESLPEPRRSIVTERFEHAVDILKRSGLSEPLLNLTGADPEERRRLGVEYFSEGLECPFLEEGACSIHDRRPLACREYLVTSPAENCAAPTPESVKCVQVDVKVSNGVARATSHEGKAKWVPLVLALDWAEANEETSSPRPAVEIAKSVFTGLE
jgi:Fe-S-cluster containining protein